MRVGILTFHRSYNYGAFLQCYSLVNRLRKDLPNSQVEIIDYMYDDNVGYKNAEKVTRGEKQKFFKTRNQAIETATAFLPLSDFRIIDKTYQRLYEKIKGKYDVIIVGSDAVFNWNGKGLPNAFMPDVIPPELKMVSYAASSHGIKYLGADERTKEFVKKSLSGFSYLGVRDNETARLVEWSGCVSQPIHNCDPTVFLDLSTLPVDMNQLRKKMIDQGVSFDKPIIGIMAGEPFGRGIKKKFGDKVQIVSVYGYNRYADVNLCDLNPFEWARVFSFFTVTITHFFHGTMFSLKNNRPTIVTERAVGLRQNYQTKIQDLLTRLDLMDLYYPMNIRTDTFLEKVLLRLGVSDVVYRKELYKRIDAAISNPILGNRIPDKLSAETQYYSSFINYLRTLENEMGGNVND